jgi:hypothetical protein
MKERYCKYRLLCGWCDKYNRRCEHIEALIAKADWEKTMKDECEHEWYQYIIDFDKERKYIAHICSKCGKATIKNI